MLKVKNLTKTFGSITALDDVSLSVKEGEFVFLTGPSGSGKTTLLRLILRDLLPDSGDILLGGESLTKVPSSKVPNLRQKIGVVFQDFKVLPERTVSENVEVALAVIGLPQDEWFERTHHVLKLVGLHDRLHHFPSQLSGGEIQRVSLARALVVNPKIILADEPTGNLDWKTAEELMDLFEKIQSEGKTILMASHHRALIDKMKKREIVLEKSKKRKPGTFKKAIKKKVEAAKPSKPDVDKKPEKKVEEKKEKPTEKPLLTEKKKKGFGFRFGFGKKDDKKEDKDEKKKEVKKTEKKDEKPQEKKEDSKSDDKKKDK